MMNNRNYFVFAVMIAIIIPIAIGGLYFADMYNKRGARDYLSQVDNQETLILGDIYLNSIFKTKDFDDSGFSEFIVKYTYGDANVRGYSIVLDNIEYPENLLQKNFKWKLLMYDGESDKYLGLKSGDFDLINNQKIVISPLIYIEKGKTQKFKLFYYYESDEKETKNIDFKAELKIE